LLLWPGADDNLLVCKKLLRNRLQKNPLTSYNYYYIFTLLLHLPQVVVPAISLGLELNGRARQLFSMTIVLAIFAFSLCMMFFPKVCVVFRTATQMEFLPRVHAVPSSKLPALCYSFNLLFIQHRYSLESDVPLNHVIFTQMRDSLSLCPTSARRSYTASGLIRALAVRVGGTTPAKPPTTPSLSMTQI